jgi:hypothetical protein
LATFLLPAASASAAGPVAGALASVTTAVSQPLAAVEQDVHPAQPEAAPAPTVDEVASEAAQAPQSLGQSATRAASETVVPTVGEAAASPTTEQPHAQPLRLQSQRASGPSRPGTGGSAAVAAPPPTSHLPPARPSVPKATSLASHALAQASAPSHEAGSGATGARWPSVQLPDRKGLLESAAESLPLQGTPLAQAPELLGPAGGGWLLGTLEEATSPLLAPLQALAGSLAPPTMPPAPSPLLELPSLPSLLPIGNGAPPGLLPATGQTSAVPPASPVPPAQTRRLGGPSATGTTTDPLPASSRSAFGHAKANGVAGATAPTPVAPSTAAATRALAPIHEAGSTASPALSPSPLPPGPGGVSPGTGAAAFGGSAPILLALAALLLAACTSMGRRLRPAHERLLAAPFQLIPQRPG